MILIKNIFKNEEEIKIEDVFSRFHNLQLIISELRASASKILEDRRNHRLCLKFGAKSMESIHFAEDLLEHLIAGAVLQSETPPPPPPEEVPSQERVESPDDKSVLGIPADNSTAYLDPVDAAVRSIMGPEGSFDLHMSPTKSLSHILNPLMSPPQTAPRPPSPVKVNVTIQHVLFLCY